MDEANAFFSPDRTHTHPLEKATALAVSEERFRSLVTTIPDIVYRIDVDGRFTFVNDAIRALGYSPEALVGIHFSEILLPADAEAVSRELVLPHYRSRETGRAGAPKLFDERRTGVRKTVELEVRLVSCNTGRTKTAVLRAAPEFAIVGRVSSAGLYHRSVEGREAAFLGTVGVIHDITERKQVEAELTRHRQHLEALVGERTAELAENNQALEREVREHGKARSRLEHLNRVLRSIRDVNHLIVREKRRDRLVRSACDILIQTRGFSAAWIVLTEGAPDRLLAEHAGLDECAFSRLVDVFRRGDRPLCLRHVLPDGDVIVTEDANAPCDACPVACTRDGNASLIIGLAHQGQSYGYLGMRVPAPFTVDEAERSLIREIAGDIAFALHGITAEEALLASETKYRTMMDGMGIGVLLIDSDMRVVEMNRQMAAWFPEATHVNKPFCHRVLPHPPHGETCESCPVVDALRYGKVHEGTLSAQRPDGARIYRIVASPLFDVDGRAKAAIETVEDITERVSLEEQLRQAQKMEVIGQLAGGIAHDFNNMIGAIQGYCDLLLEDLAESDPLYANVGRIRACANRSEALTRQLLAFSRKQVLSLRVLDLNRLINGMRNMIGRLLGENIELRVSLAPALKSVKADAGQIEQVLMNLAINARDAMPEGGTLTIETANVNLDEEYAREHAEACPGPHVMLAVTDSGCGMDRAIMARIFEPFFTTKEAGKGTGLGLATVYGIVKQSGGSVYVRSAPGRGSAFEVYLPSTDEVPDTEKSPTSTAAQGGGETILVVEDDTMLRDLIVRIAKRGGYRAMSASDGYEALHLGEEFEGTIDILVTDVVMPQMSGRQLAEKFLRSRPDTKVLYMSGYTSNAIVNDGVLKPGVHFIQKPFTPIALLKRIRNVLGNQ